eukprot:TRINITY_DN81589_c0_g1_i1.p1 TRINITY_DN81589_c0_g1~~TRINITY_DN81589_c0_g1_i1.p1  ORF type:complete len:352 (+),score=77.58 TRINITY_DN81589_c0_g1_i1:88-1143(+)
MQTVKVFHENGQQSAPHNVGTDVTCQAFATWLTELRATNSRTMQELMSEMTVIREGISSNNAELTDFKRHGAGISQQMQAQLTDLREKLTSAFGEITSLVKTKTQSDQEMMSDINTLQQSISVKNQELEALKRSYNQAYSQLQSSLIQIQNHLQVTNSDVQQARASCERVQRETQGRFGEIETNLRAVEEELQVGNAENRNQMLQLQEDISRIHDAITNVSADFTDHKRMTNSVHNKLQTSVWSLEDSKKRMLQTEAHAKARSPQPSYEPAIVAAEPIASPAPGQPKPVTQVARPAVPAVTPYPVAGPGIMRPGSVTLPMPGSRVVSQVGVAAVPWQQQVISAKAPVVYRK